MEKPRQSLQDLPHDRRLEDDIHNTLGVTAFSTRFNANPSLAGISHLYYQQYPRSDFVCLQNYFDFLDTSRSFLQASDSLSLMMVYSAVLPETKSPVGRRAVFNVSSTEEWEFITTKLHWDMRGERSLGQESRDCLRDAVSMRGHFVKIRSP